MNENERGDEILRFQEASYIRNEVRVLKAWESMGCPVTELKSNKNQINKQYMFATGHRLLGNNPKRKMELLGNKPKRKMERINKCFLQAHGV